ncbi:MAG TPA: hypothetical protein GXX30_06390 [Firmicutes bacterium]|uniref:DUF6754 domain-containing protein n=1 Tax=Candidatus Fermentithermobacillus carboniphilus TaxID=3085328 RepID=A0AAT9LD36_9FIRM|nr:MAG: hypothetical protein IMF26_02520 [Candidatus Fermentithermobacillus carboniphilus]HHW18513.1 hypothetical protein [Candidatus Fermentithermobacillaceae bacterium]
MKIVSGYVAAFWLELVFLVTLLVVIARARKGLKIPEVYKVAGLDHLDEAIGRATEMGRPVHFSPGIGYLDNAQTLAAFAILSYAAKACARYDTPIIVTNRYSVIYPITEGIVRQAYLEVGKPESFVPDNVRFIAEDQFAYASGVTGIMNRERPAANLLIGAFWAESLIFAEVGNSVGSIQISGTANTAQIPFFVAACDYCLIGEELFAASAYLSKDPVLMGNLIAEDWGKMVMIAFILIGAILQTFGNSSFTKLLAK